MTGCQLKSVGYSMGMLHKHDSIIAGVDLGKLRDGYTDWLGRVADLIKKSILMLG